MTLTTKTLTTMLFDFDGVLVDSAADLAAAVARLLLAEGLEPFSASEVQAMTGDGAARLVERAFERRGAALPEGAVERFRADYAARCLDLTRPFPGMPELLKGLIARRPRPALAVVTNKPQAIAERIIEGLDLGPFFDAVVGPESTPRRKPDPAHVRCALEQLGRSPGEAVLVGDSPSDVQAGRAAGTRTVAVLWGYRPRQALEAAAPDHLVGSVDELAQLLRQPV